MALCCLDPGSRDREQCGALVEKTAQEGANGRLFLILSATSTSPTGTGSPQVFFFFSDLLSRTDTSPTKRTFFFPSFKRP